MSENIDNFEIRFAVPETKYSTLTFSDSFMMDSDISFKASAILTTIIYFAQRQFPISLKKLAKIRKEGKNAIKSGIDELVENNYLILERIITNGYPSGYIYIITEKFYKDIGKLGPTKIIPIEEETGGIKNAPRGVENQASIYNYNINNINNIPTISTKALIGGTPHGANAPRPLVGNSNTRKKTYNTKNYQTMNAMILNFTTNLDLQEALKIYLDIRRKRGLQPEQWKIMLDDLKEFCSNDEQRIAKTKSASAGGWGTIIATWDKEPKNKSGFVENIEGDAGINYGPRRDKEKYLEELRKKGMPTY